MNIYWLVGVIPQLGYVTVSVVIQNMVISMLGACRVFEICYVSKDNIFGGLVPKCAQIPGKQFYAVMPNTRG